MDPIAKAEAQIYIQRSEGYHLQLKLFSEKLSGHLVDLENGFIYEQIFDFDYFKAKKYPPIFTEVFNVFSNGINFTDEVTQQEKINKKIKKHKNYKIGEKVVENNGFYCVNKNGVIEVMVNMMFPSTKSVFQQQIILQFKELRSIEENDRMDLKIKSVEEKMEERLQEKINEIRQHYELQLLRVKNLDIYDPESYFFWKFRIMRGMIIYVGEETWTQLLLKDAIPYEEQVKFSLTIRQTSSRYIMFGIVNRNRRKERYSLGTGFGTTYYAVNGYVYGPEKTQNNGFSTNETVTMKVNLRKGLVEWSVGGITRASSNMDLLKDKESEFAPYIEMYTNSDCVEWHGRVE